jgi:mRNA interferase RelE/StbE
MYSVYFRKSARKELEQLPKTVVKNLVPIIESLADNPRPANSKKLIGQEENLWRIRNGNYRVIYLIDDDIQIIDIRRIRHRKDVYN